MVVFPLLAIVCLATVFVFATDTFKIKYFDYALTPLVLEKDLFALAGIEKGKTPIMLKTCKDIEMGLIKHPYIESVTCTKQYPDTIVLKMKLKQEYLQLKQGTQYIVVDAKGLVMRVSEKPSQCGQIEGITVLYYKVGDYLKTDNQGLFESCLDLINLLQQADLNKGVIIKIQNKEAVLEIQKKLRVKFGTFSQIEEQFNQFTAVYEDLVKRRSINGEIDVSGKGLPTYRPFGN